MGSLTFPLGKYGLLVFSLHVAHFVFLIADPGTTSEQ